MDERMRGIQREAAGGDKKAGAQLLRERIRSGELTEERIQLAAHLGDERARKVFGEEEQSEIDTIEGLQEWVRRIGELGEIAGLGSKEVFVRTIIASAWRVLSVFNKARPNDNRPRQAIEEAEQWCLADQDGRASASLVVRVVADDALAVAREVATDVDSESDDATSAAGNRSARVDANRAAIVAAYAAAATNVADASRIVRVAAAHAAHAAASIHTDKVHYNAAEPSVIQTAVRDELVPLVLDEGDPVRERIKSRKAKEEAS